MLDLAAIRAGLDAIARNLDAHERYVLDAARTAPFGGNHAWDAVLRNYGLAPDTPIVRLEAAQRAGQREGASMDEVRRAASSIAQKADAELTRTLASIELGPAGSVKTPGAAPLEPVISSLKVRLRQYEETLSQRYAGFVCANAGSVSSSVGSVFANAASTAKLTPWANVRFEASRVLSCDTCGAPQQVELDFHCRYCRNPMRAPAGG